MLHGCIIGDNTLVASVLRFEPYADRQNCLIGAHTLIAEGKEIPDNVLVLGQPGRVVRCARDDEVKMLSSAADSYVTIGTLPPPAQAGTLSMMQNSFRALMEERLSRRGS